MNLDSLHCVQRKKTQITLIIFYVNLGCQNDKQNDTEKCLVYEQKYLYLTLPETGTFKIMAPADLMSREICFLRGPYSHPVAHDRRGEEAL